MDKLIIQLTIRESRGIRLTLFIPGEEYRRQALHDVFGGQRRGGICTPAKHPVIFIFTGREGKQYGYKDEWKGGLFYYTGKGQEGHMEMMSGNKAIKNHQVDGKEIHLFRMMRPRWVRYEGRMEYVRHRTERHHDKHGKQRNIIRFVLAPVEEVSGPHFGKVSRVEGIIDYQFTNKRFLLRALTRKDYAQKVYDLDGRRIKHQEALATLGDALLRAILTENLFRSGDERKGEITQKRADDERNKRLGEIGRKKGLSRQMIASPGEEKGGIPDQESALALTIEAIIGALHLDCGYDKTREVVLGLLR